MRRQLLYTSFPSGNYIHQAGSLVNILHPLLPVFVGSFSVPTHRTDTEKHISQCMENIMNKYCSFCDLVCIMLIRYVMGGVIGLGLVWQCDARCSVMWYCWVRCMMCIEVWLGVMRGAVWVDLIFLPQYCQRGRPRLNCLCPTPHLVMAPVLTYIFTLDNMRVIQSWLTPPPS